MNHSFEHPLRSLLGENPHQNACLYAAESVPACSLLKAQLVQGEPLSFNNIVDTDGALALIREFPKEEGVTAVLYHHGNPCAVAVGERAETAFLQAKENCDATSVIEGILVLNGTVNKALAERIHEMYLHVLVCMEIEEEALRILADHTQLTVFRHPNMMEPVPSSSVEVKSILGGLLVQDYNLGVAEKYETITGQEPDEDTMHQLKIAWRVVKHTKTNAMLLVRDNGTVGIGPGLNNRIWSVEEALRRAGERARGSVLASDAIIPLCESVTLAGEAGVTAIIEPGGWYKEDENIAQAEKYGITMVTTGINQFKH